MISEPFLFVLLCAKLITMRVFLAVVLVLTATFGFSQNKAIKWINKNAHPIKSDHSNVDDFSFLKSELKDKTVVALGEASHGTHEFFFQKGRMIKFLITKLGYKTLGFEFPESFITPVNQYLQGEKDDLKKIMDNFFMYQTEEIYNIFQWIKEYNNTQAKENKVVVFGYDKEDYQSRPLERDKLMAENAINYLKPRPAKSIFWAHNVHLGKDTTMARFEAMGYHLKKEYGNQYYALCFDTYQGTVNVLSDGAFEKHEFTAAINSFSELFATAKYASFYVSFLKENPLNGQRNLITNIYSNWDPNPQKKKSLPMKPGIDFDGLFFIKTTSASKKL